MRSGLPLDAIDVYLKVLTQYPTHRMISQFGKLYKNRPKFLNYVDLSLGDKQEYYVPDSFVGFDKVLERACGICQLDDLDSDQRM